MDYGLALWGVLTFLAILGGLSVLDQIQEFHKRGMERVRRGER